MKHPSVENAPVVALAGNPNVGKSTLFNALTGLRQHTGNWPGKTVALAEGVCTHAGEPFVLTDLPGCYSLFTHSPEEDIARDFILSGRAEAVIVVCDATCLCRNLALALQILSLTDRVVVCVNLLDEAARRQVHVDLAGLEAMLGVPVVGCVARDRKGLRALMQAVVSLRARPRALPRALGGAEAILEEAARIAGVCVSAGSDARDRRLDRVLAGKYTGFAVMLLLLGLIFYLTILGANYPSQLLGRLLFGLQDRLLLAWQAAGWTPWLGDMLLLGVYRTVAWVVSVMLPPMVIFFPLFTLLEDLGYLPRVAFNLDKCFHCCRACGKQSLTMCMGLGCNAVGVVGCRIIDSPRERLIAILTNSFVPCNGRFAPPYKGKQKYGRVLTPKKKQSN